MYSCLYYLENFLNLDINRCQRTIQIKFAYIVKALYVVLYCISLMAAGYCKQTLICNQIHCGLVKL